MKWTKLHRVAISLPVAILAALVMVAISELTYNHTQNSLQNLTQTYETRHKISELMQEMLDAETGLP